VTQSSAQSSASPAPAAAAPVSAAAPTPTPQFALKTNGSDSATDLPNLAATSVDFYPGINSTLSTSNPGPVQWPQSRPTLTGGSIAGRMSGLSFEG
jgi:transcription initiation factor TFIID subunit 12